MVDLAPEKQTPRESITSSLGIKDLVQTEGFSKLTDRQQQMIRSSFLINQRAEKPNNLQSKNHIDIHNCHGAIASLEDEHFSKIRTDEFPPGFFKANYFKIDYSWGGEIAMKLDSKIKAIGYPSVVHAIIYAKTDLPEYDPVATGRLKPDHSFLVLGHNRKGEVMVWDKEVFFDQYRAITLEKVCEQHQAYKSWGIRSLRQNHSQG